MSDATDPRLLRLGDEIRNRRQAGGLSMGQLADAAHVSRSTLDRVENPKGVRPQANNMANILAALNVTESDARGFLPDDDAHWVEVVLRRLRLAPLLAVARYTSTHDGQPDLVVTHQGGTIITMQFKSRGADAEHAEAEAVDALSRAGFLVSRPL